MYETVHESSCFMKGLWLVASERKYLLKTGFAPLTSSSSSSQASARQMRRNCSWNVSPLGSTCRIAWNSAVFFSGAKAVSSIVAPIFSKYFFLNCMVRYVILGAKLVNIIQNSKSQNQNYRAKRNNASSYPCKRSVVKSHRRTMRLGTSQPIFFKSLLRYFANDK